MVSIDTNLLIAALAPGHAMHEKARVWLEAQSKRNDIIISEFVLVELFTLLCNPVVLSPPLIAKDAVTVCQSFRLHPNWRLLGFCPDSAKMHNALWEKASSKNFARRRIYDVRLALTLLEFGVTEFATVNTKDFKTLGFKKVWNPLSE